MKKNNFQNFEKMDSKVGDYAYYSRVLKEPFDSFEDLVKAEEAYFAEQKAKEDKVSQKKSDAKTVEDAFKNLNATRKSYKEELNRVTQKYRENLTALKTAFEAEKAVINSTLATAEENYSNALKAFNEKYPEGYHLTLKDGDFETTISSTSSNSDAGNLDKFNSIAEVFDWLFG